MYDAEIDPLHWAYIHNVLYLYIQRVASIYTMWWIYVVVVVAITKVF